MNKLEAIGYLVYNGPRWSEWAEAGLLKAIEYIYKSEKNSFEVPELEELISKAEKY
jgi:hypothetical protein